MKTTILIIIALISITTFNSCSKTNELPPKTGDINADLLLPKGTLLTAEEREAINKRLEEYSDATDL